MHRAAITRLCRRSNYDRLHHRASNSGVRIIRVGRVRVDYVESRERTDGPGSLDDPYGLRKSKSVRPRTRLASQRMEEEWIDDRVRRRRSDDGEIQSGRA